MRSRVIWLILAIIIIATMIITALPPPGSG